ncbi:MAG: cadmium resistance transporter [bacterium]
MSRQHASAAARWSIWYQGSIAEILPIFALAAGAYFATNIDSFVLLTAMLAHGRAQRRRIVLGFGASYLIALEANLIPLAYLGLLGVVPLALGAKGVVDLLRKGRSPRKTEKVAAPAGRSVIYAVALTLVSNSADTIIVLSALLADSDPGAELVILLSCVAAAGVVAASAAYAVGHPRVERGIQRIAPTLTPLILLCVGFYILANTATDLLPG